MLLCWGMVKKVVIAAAGQGTRMLSLSKDKSEHLIEVNQKPFLYYLFDNLIGLYSKVSESEAIHPGTSFR